jgi:hypothetical protein
MTEVTGACASLCYTTRDAFVRFARHAVVLVGSASSPPFLPAVSFSAKSKLNVSGMDPQTCV